MGSGGAAEPGRVEGDGPADARDHPRGVEFNYIGRPERAAPSEGYPAAHRSEQERIVLTTFETGGLPGN